MPIQQHLTQIVKPQNGKLTIEIPLPEDESSSAYHVTIDIVPQLPALPDEEQQELIDRLFGSIPDLPEVNTNLAEYPFEDREW